MTRAMIDALITLERERQEIKWAGKHAWGYGSCASDRVDDMVKAAVLTEECGEVARALLDGKPERQLRDELVQVAAVAIAWLEGIA